MTTGRRAIIWTAVSSEEQASGDKDSLAHQERLGREHAAKHGLDVVRVLRSDDSRSIIRLDVAMRNPKLEYSALVDAIDKRAFDVLLFYAVDRLGRTISLVATVQELCRAAGIALYDCSNPPTTISAEAGDTDRIVGSIQGAFAQGEIDKLKKRRRFGIQARARRGVFTTSIPFGYMLDADGKPIIDEPQAAIVRRIYSDYLAGHGLPRIAAALNAEGIPTPKGNAWQVGTIAYFLNNTARYSGLLEYNRYSRVWRDAPASVPGQHPAIIDATIAERIQQERAARAANRKLADTPNLLSGVVWCMDCDAPMRLGTTNSGRRHVKRLTYLRCYAGAAHPFWSVRADAILPLIADKMQQLTELDIDLLCTPTVTPDVTAAQIDALHREVDRLTRSLQAADDDYYVTGKLDTERHARIVRRLRADVADRYADIVRLERQQQSAADLDSRRAALRDIMAHGSAILRDADVTRANVWLRRHVRVWIRDRELNDVAIEWLPPKSV